MSISNVLGLISAVKYVGVCDSWVSVPHPPSLLATLSGLALLCNQDKLMPAHRGAHIRQWEDVRGTWVRWHAPGKERSQARSRKFWTRGRQRARGKSVSRVLPATPPTPGRDIMGPPHSLVLGKGSERSNELTSAPSLTAFPDLRQPWVPQPCPSLTQTAATGDFSELIKRGRE